MLKNTDKFIRPELREFLKALGETKSKSEEDQIIARDYINLKKKFEQITQQFGS
jgi:hypothetical protein